MGSFHSGIVCGVFCQQDAVCKKRKLKLLAVYKSNYNFCFPILHYAFVCRLRFKIRENAKMDKINYYIHIYHNVGNIFSSKRDYRMVAKRFYFPNKLVCFDGCDCIVSISASLGMQANIFRRGQAN